MPALRRSQDARPSVCSGASTGGTMGEMITLTASDGHKFSAYDEKPAGPARGGLVVIQEIFGVNAHMRRVAGGYAADGYHAIAPAIFDRAERGVELGYSKPEVDRGIEIRRQIPIDAMLRDRSEERRVGKECRSRWS